MATTKILVLLTRNDLHWTDPLDAITTRSDEAQADAKLAVIAVEAGWELERDSDQPELFWAVKEFPVAEKGLRAAADLGGLALGRRVKMEPAAPNSSALVVKPY